MVKTLVALAAGATPWLANAQNITLRDVGTFFRSPVGIDYQEPLNRVVVSANYPSGDPRTFYTIDANGSQAVFSNASGFGDEVKIATVRSGNIGGFTTGDLFTGNGVDGQIVRITGNGSTVMSPWVTLPGGGHGLMRGSLNVDRTGAWGGDLVVCTTAGEVWRVNSAGVPTFIADVDTHLEGLNVVPDDPGRYGPLAGKVIAGAEGQGLMYAFDAAGGFETYNLGVSIEDIDMIVANEYFIGVDFANGRLLEAAPANWAPYVGDFLLAQEFGGGQIGLFRLYWDGVNVVADALPASPGSLVPGQWEHVTFSPTPAPAPGCAALLGLGGLCIAGRRRR